MIKIVLVGCNGKMGKTITNLIETEENIKEKFKVIAGVSKNNLIEQKYPVYKNINNLSQEADVVIDFSKPASLNSILEYSKSKDKPIVLCTTGYTKEDIDKIKNHSLDYPVFYCSNTSIGVTILAKISEIIAKTLKYNFDIEIIEKHHNKKSDAPSGTAIMIADKINNTFNGERIYVYDRHIKEEKRDKKDIGIHSVRCGNISGEHEVLFAGDDEIIKISHTSFSRKIFANGAIKSAEFIINAKKGLYSMDDVLKL